jgi:DNA polymerase III epsilon subunit-like protein
VYLFFDTETTGLPKKKHASMRRVANWPRIVELGWVLTDRQGTVIEEEGLLVRPDGFVVPAASTAIHGITTEQAAGEGADIREVLARFLAVLEQSELICGHHISFDHRVIGAELIRADMPVDLLDRPRFCTMEASKALRSPVAGHRPRPFSLSALYLHLFNEPFTGAHRALADAKACAACFFAIRDLQKNEEDKE